MKEDIAICPFLFFVSIISLVFAIPHVIKGARKILWIKKYKKSDPILLNDLLAEDISDRRWVIKKNLGYLNDIYTGRETDQEVADMAYGQIIFDFIFMSLFVVVIGSMVIIEMIYYINK